MAAMNETTYEQILSDLKNQIYYPVYLLHGEEPYFIDEIADAIGQKVLSDQEKEFNQTVVYGKDSSVPDIISYAKRYPMMANYQVLIIKEAQDLDDVEEFLPYVQNPLKSTILVICYKYKKVDGRKSFYKAVEKAGIVFESKRIYEDRIPDWITSYSGKRNYPVSPKASQLLAEFVGNDLTKIVNELGKLFILIPEGTMVSEEIIERNIGISKDFNVFELQKALGKKDIYKANQIIQYFAANQKDNPLVKVLPMLYSFFSKILTYHYLKDKSTNNVAAELSIKPFFVRDYTTAAKNYPVKKVVPIISILREYDVKSKGVDNTLATDGELMKEMVFRILH